MTLKVTNNITSSGFKQIQNHTIELGKTSYPNDSVEISSGNKSPQKTDKDSERSKIKNRIIGFSALCAAFVVSAPLISKYQTNKIAKLYKEKLFLSNLPEKIEFNGVKTVEEGIKYAKDFLGIKYIDKNFTLEAINTAIKGLVDVSNANKGKLFMPKGLRFKALKDKQNDTLAYVTGDIHSPDFGDLVINKNYFSDKVLNLELDKALFYKNGEKIYEITSAANDVETSWKVGHMYPIPQNELCKLIKKYYIEKNSLTIQEKQVLFYSLEYGHNKAESIQRKPLDILNYISRNKSKFLKENNINLNFSELENMKSEKLTEYVENLVKKLEKAGSYLDIVYEKESPTCIINHEMGHLQDYAKNLKGLDIKQREFHWKNFLSRTKENDELQNRWGSLKQEQFSNMYKDNPKKFKKHYPDFYEFVTNREIQQTAGKISTYAQSGIGEFIAETYAAMIAKRKIPDDVMSLYKKYKGPELPAMT